MQMLQHASPDTIKVLMGVFVDGAELQKEAIFTAIMFYENYHCNDSEWAMDEDRSEWDFKMFELIDRLFR